MNDGDAVYITGAYPWTDGLIHIVSHRNTAIGGANFRCTPATNHAGCTLMKTQEAPTCVRCLAAR